MEVAVFFHPGDSFFPQYLLGHIWDVLLKAQIHIVMRLSSLPLLELNNKPSMGRQDTEHCRAAGFGEEVGHWFEGHSVLPAWPLLSQMTCCRLLPVNANRIKL